MSFIYRYEAEAIAAITGKKPWKVSEFSVIADLILRDIQAHKWASRVYTK